MGGGGHCHSCIDVIESAGIYQIKGIVLPVLENSKPILGYPVIGIDHDLPELLKQTPNILICIGQVKDFQIRKNHFEFLKKNGVKVSCGTLEKQGEWINRRFFKFHRTQLPYVILKWAQTKNGLMDKTRVENDTGVNWITQPETKTIVHKWRAQEDAILVGANTVINDSPVLDVRHASGKNPLRLVIDPNNKIPDNHEFWNLKIPSVVFSKSKRVINSHTEFSLLQDNEDISSQVLKLLACRNIISVIIEGGKATLESFINNRLWDEARILTGKNNWDNGLVCPQVSGYTTEEFKLNTDQIRIITREIRI